MSRPHNWLLKIEPQAQHQFDKLAKADKQAIFRRLRDLLTADDPYSLPAVEMLREKKFERVRKFRAGDYRIFFVINAVEVIDQKHHYKGKLYLLDIRNRREAY